MNPTKVSLAMLEEAGMIPGSYIRRVPASNAFQQFQSSSVSSASIDIVLIRVKYFILYAPTAVRKLLFAT